VLGLGSLWQIVGETLSSLDFRVLGLGYRWQIIGETLSCQLCLPPPQLCQNLCAIVVSALHILAMAHLYRGTFQVRV
jgi:hypothetical protein